MVGASALRARVIHALRDIRTMVIAWPCSLNWVIEMPMCDLSSPAVLDRVVCPRCGRAIMLHWVSKHYQAWEDYCPRCHKSICYSAPHEVIRVEGEVTVRAVPIEEPYEAEDIQPEEVEA